MWRKAFSSTFTVAKLLHLEITEQQLCQKRRDSSYAISPRSLENALNTLQHCTLFHKSMCHPFFHSHNSLADFQQLLLQKKEEWLQGHLVFHRSLQLWRCKNVIVSTFWDNVPQMQAYSQVTQIVNVLLLDFCNSVHCSHKPSALARHSSPSVICRGLNLSKGIQLCCISASGTAHLPCDISQDVLYLRGCNVCSPILNWEGQGREHDDLIMLCRFYRKEDCHLNVVQIQVTSSRRKVCASVLSWYIFSRREVVKILSA